MPKSEDIRLVRIFEDITSRLLASTDPNRLYDAAVQIAMQTTGAQACSLYLEQDIAEPEQEPSRIVMVSGAGFEKHRIGVTYEKGDGLTGRIWQTSQSVKLDSQAQIEDPAIGWRGRHNRQVSGMVPEWRSYSLIGVPLRAGTRTIGVLKVENKQPGEPACFTTDDQLLLETIASTIAMAIENQRSLEKSHGSILGALSDMTGMLVSSDVGSFQTMCDRIVQGCIEIFNAEACSLYIQDENLPDFIVMISGAGYEKLRRGARYRKGEGLTGTIWDRGQSVKYDTRQEVENLSTGWRGLNNPQVLNRRSEWECCSLMGVPLRIGSRTIGVLKVENKQPVKSSYFTHNELRTLAIVASNIGLALEMRRKEVALYTKGERARDFAHDVRNEVGTAEDALEAATAAANDSRAPQIVLERIDIANAAMKRIEDMRKRLFKESHSGVRRETVSINELLRRVAERGRVLKSFDIELVVKSLDNDAYAQIELDEVLRAFDKLLENAIDAIREADTQAIWLPKVWITGQLKKGQSDSVQKAAILFVDNGPGFTPDQRLDFQKNRDIKSTKHAGLGRGVALAHRCLADNGITLGIIDPPPSLTSRGAAFEVTIPLHIPRTLRALVIDDQETWLRLVKSKVGEDAGIELETNTSYELVWNAARGLENATAELSTFDLILLDCHFTEQPYEGPELFDNLLARHPDIAKRVILMSREPQFLSRRDVRVIHKSEDVLKKLPQVLHELRKRK